MEDQEKIICKHCSHPNLKDAIYCESCGKEINEIELSAADRIIAEDQKKKMKQAGTTLLVVAIIQIVVGTLLGGISNFETEQLIGIYGIGIVFFGLYFWSRKSPFPAVVAGLIIFITVHLIDGIVDPNQIYKGLIMKVIVLIFLIKGVSAGLEYRKNQQLNRT